MRPILTCVALATAGVLAACAAVNGPAPEAPVANEDPAALPNQGERVAMQYVCGEAGDAMAVRFFDQDSIAKVTMPSISDEPILMACSYTRIGPECSAGDLWARFDVIYDRADIWKTDSDFDIDCTLEGIGEGE